MHRGVPAEHCYSEDYLDDKMSIRTHGYKAGMPASQLAIRETDCRTDGWLQRAGVAQSV